MSRSSQKLDDRFAGGRERPCGVDAKRDQALDHLWNDMILPAGLIETRRIVVVPPTSPNAGDPKAFQSDKKWSDLVDEPPNLDRLVQADFPETRQPIYTSMRIVIVQRSLEASCHWINTSPDLDGDPFIVANHIEVVKPVRAMDIIDSHGSTAEDLRQRSHGNLFGTSSRSIW